LYVVTLLLHTSHTTNLSKLTVKLAEERIHCLEWANFWHNQANMWLGVQLGLAQWGHPVDYCQDRYRQAIQLAAEWELKADNFQD
jgi:hypothetical protein